LTVPTVEDRVAQTVAKHYIEPVFEAIFVEESFGYRPGRSALDAVGQARKMCWKYDWVLEFDIVGLFDNIDHELLYKAFDKHVEDKWLRLYVRRWSEAPIQKADGEPLQRTSGVSQGGVLSPLLANLFLHYAFDLWMKREFPDCPFERYADDGIAHCATLEEAEQLLEKLTLRMGECKLELHPDKTRIVYCKDDRRNGKHDKVSFDFLGYTFKPRDAVDRRGRRFTGYLPALSNDSAKRFRDKIRELKLHRMTWADISLIASILNPMIRGWMGYFGAYYPSRMRVVLRCVNLILMRWAMRKFKRMRRSKKKAIKWLRELARRNPNLFFHWSRGYAL
jgi:group II intron reverse transcriptase/maturase